MILGILDLRNNNTGVHRQFSLNGVEAIAKGDTELKRLVCTHIEGTLSSAIEKITAALQGAKLQGITFLCDPAEKAFDVWGRTHICLATERDGHAGMIVF